MPENEEKLVEALFSDRGDDLLRHPEAYLFRIAANLMYENWLKVRPEGNARSDGIDPELLDSEELSTEAAAAQQQCIDALQRVLRVMPPTRQQVVVLHLRDGMTYAEISARLGISVGMVKKHLAKGLARCREQLSSAGNEAFLAGLVNRNPTPDEADAMFDRAREVLNVSG